MVNHEVVTLLPLGLVNGHVPLVVHNVTTGEMGLHCRTCGWIGRPYGRRWADKVDGTWRIHAGDLAMGITLAHGQIGNGCHCASCARATRDAATTSSPTSTEAVAQDDDSAGS
jgi:hypothetical protein